MSDNIYLIDKECYELRKKIADIDKVIKEQNDQKSILVEKYNNLISRKKYARRSKYRYKRKKNERTVIKKEVRIDKKQQILDEAKRFNKKYKGRTVRLNKFRYTNNIEDKDKIVINVSFSNINSSDPHKQVAIRNNILKRMMIKKLEGGVVNYKFYPLDENNIFHYSDFILESLKSNNNYKISDTNIAYSNVDMFSSISHRLHCFNFMKFFYNEKLTNMLKGKDYFKPRIVWNVKETFPKLSKDNYWYILHNNERILITNENRKKLITNKKNGMYVIQSSFKTKTVHNKKCFISMFISNIFISNTLYSFLFYDGLINFFDKSDPIKLSQIGLYKKLVQNMKTIIFDVTNEIYKRIDKYYVSKFIEEFQIFEYIFLIDDNGELILHDIDINTKPFINKKCERLKHVYYKSLFYNFINRLFFPNEKIHNEYNKFMLIFSKKLKNN
jgi:hypothetical protein